MRIVFSEHHSDYQNYIFPYAIWGFPDEGETAAKMFAHGFLPASMDMDRFYLCRHVRVDLGIFKLSSENRRILRKGEGISMELVPRESFDYSEQRRTAYKDYTDIKFGKDVMSFERLDALFSSKMITHCLVFRDESNGQEVGTVTLHLEPGNFAFYYYSFYDLNYHAQNLGMYMMTSTVQLFLEANYKHIYLGSCYKKNALYKTQFKAAEFFNGFSWSGNIKELKYLIERDHPGVEQHLLETPEYCEKFYDNDPTEFKASTTFQLK
jgi:arginyl-tRNA--protein-N-Asp/Glu arginylyltransferase